MPETQKAETDYAPSPTKVRAEARRVIAAELKLYEAIQRNGTALPKQALEFLIAIHTGNSGVR